MSGVGGNSKSADHPRSRSEFASTVQARADDAELPSITPDFGCQMRMLRGGTRGRCNEIFGRELFRILEKFTPEVQNSVRCCESLVRFSSTTVFSIASKITFLRRPPFHEASIAHSSSPAIQKNDCRRSIHPVKRSCAGVRLAQSRLYKFRLSEEAPHRLHSFVRQRDTGAPVVTKIASSLNPSTILEELGPPQPRRGRHA